MLPGVVRDHSGPVLSAVKRIVGGAELASDLSVFANVGTVTRP